MSEPSKLTPSSAKHPKARLAPSVDSVTTIASDGSRRDIHPADVGGRFTVARRWSGWALIAFYLVLPWIPVNGHPAVFIDIAEGRFHFFGYTLAAQDTWLLFFGLTGLGFALFFLTALFGRLWCGWACPQTVYLEHVYRLIERWIDGDAPERRALKEAPLTGAKVGKRVAKHGLFIVASLLITHLFLSYFVSLPEVWHMMSAAPGEHWAAFVFVFVSAGILYFNFAWFREQLCIVICPYGRLQSALTDDNSMVIGYDTKRGEPRGKLGTPDAGACVACNRCVQVCPTGIDIRHGLQLECIGCAACIDACDEVMTKVGRPKGLVRYDSFVGLAGGRTRWVRPRTIVYFILLLVGVAVATFAFSTVKPAGFLVYRMSGAAYFVGEDAVRNQFMVRLVNKRSIPATYLVTAEGVPEGVHLTGFDAPVQLAAQAEQVSPLVLSVDRHRYTGAFHFTVKVEDVDRTYELSRVVEFMGPDPKLLREDEEERVEHARESAGSKKEHDDDGK
ncbi:Putative electron transport protein YccM [Lacunisphaera limnophila]|uniref:Electron transport protein YccM n=1 Tax=Lacunisphaera limnophila TaxID=1838286 RepID=A0A1I7PI42_9BACT|nr:cytochrome c oxidase accessory protein CcoG [Lacunisphaera limnophila]AOS43298.1 Putative electron transport protein YccM [Lacunisphaera limnophila]